MVVLAASAVSRSGKLLLSRQFADIPRSRIEGLLTSFGRLVPATSSSSFVETDSVRYVYQAFDDVYLLLVTTRESNILEDMETLRLFVKVVPEYSPLTEEGILTNAFEITFALDEIIELGHREPLTAAQIKTLLAMESAAEAKEIAKRKEQERIAKKEALEKSVQIDRERALREKAGGKSASGFGSNTTGGGMGMSASSMMSSSSSMSSSSGMTSAPSTYASSQPAQSSSSSAAAASTSSSGPAAAGMKLGAKSKPKATDLLAAMIKEGEVAPTSPSVSLAPSSVGAGGSVSAAASSSAASGATEGISLNITESLIATLSRDGTVNHLEAKGSLNLMVLDSAPSSHVLARLNLGSSPSDRAYAFRTHPNISKELFAEGILALKDRDRSFPTNTDLAVLRWTWNPSREEYDRSLPISVAVWPSSSSNGTDVTVEYNINGKWDEIESLEIRVRCEERKPVVTNEVGSYKVENGFLIWKIPLVDASNGNAVLEFKAPGVSNAELFFPVSVSFTSRKTFASVDVASVETVNGAKKVPFQALKILTAEEYKLV